MAGVRGGWNKQFSGCYPESIVGARSKQGRWEGRGVGVGAAIAGSGSATVERSVSPRQATSRCEAAG